MRDKMTGRGDLLGRANHILNKYGNASVLDGTGDLFAAKAAEPNTDPRFGGLLDGLLGPQSRPRR